MHFPTVDGMEENQKKTLELVNKLLISTRFFCIIYGSYLICSLPVTFWDWFLQAKKVWILILKSNMTPVFKHAPEHNAHYP